MTTDREEFEKCRRKLYALADRMGMKLTVIVRRKADTGKPNAAPQGREPGDD